MSEITDLKINGKRVKVRLDGKPAISLLAETMAKENLRVGQELSDSRIEALAESDQLQRCLDAAARYLGYRPQSESELQKKLEQRGFEGHIIETTLARLRQQGLVDDSAFVRFWTDNRQSFSPRSQRLTRLELKRKGVDDGTIDRIIGEIDDNDSAYRAALGRAQRLSLSDYEVFRRRIGEYLRRRGFDYGVINHTVERIWHELREQHG